MHGLLETLSAAYVTSWLSSDLCMRFLRSLIKNFCLPCEMDPYQRISSLTQQLKYMEENIAGYRASLREAKAENEVTGSKQRLFFWYVMDKMGREIDLVFLFFACLCLTLTRSCRSVFPRRILL